MIAAIPHFSDLARPECLVHFTCILYHSLNFKFFSRDHLFFVFYLVLLGPALGMVPRHHHRFGKK